MTRIQRRLRQGSFTFSELFDDKMTRSELITMFMALLELIKLNRVKAEQKAAYEDITLSA